MHREGIRWTIVAAALAACAAPAPKPAPPPQPAPVPSAPAPVPPPALAPPPTAKHDVTTTYFGLTVHDPYRWLEDADAAPVKAWIKAQNAYTEKVLGSFPERDAIAKRVGELALISTERSAPMVVAGQLFFLQQTPPQPQAVLAARKWPDGKVKVLYDPNQSKGTAITGYWPSPDGKYVAYGTAEGGSEATTIRLLRVADGKSLPDRMPYAGGGTTPQAMVWDANSKGLLYVRLPTPGTVPAGETKFNASLYHHVIGQPGDKDKQAFGKDLSPVAEYSFVNSGDGKRRAIMVHFGDGSPDHVFLERAHKWHEVLGPEADVREAATWLDGRFLAVSYQDAPRGKLVAVSANGKSQVLVPEQAQAMDSVFAIKHGFLLAMVDGPVWRIDHYDARGKLVRRVPLPDKDFSVWDVASNDRADQALIDYSGFRFPNRWGSYDPKSGKLTTIFDVKSPANYSELQTASITATSKDGTKVPVTVVYMAGTARDGHRPTILTGYGGYKVVRSPRFIGRRLGWLEHGGVWALANIRGGGEFGEGWHSDGMLGKKQNGFDDFHAAVEALKKSGWTDTRHLGILGGSNGGLLMGAEITQHPDAIHVAVSFVGIYDMLRSELWPNGRYNVSEYGTVTKEPDFKWLYAYSPLQHVTPHTNYPAVLLVTGENDPRVAPWQSRKYVATLQAANASQNPILLLTRTHEGHGVTASFNQRVGNDVAALTFFAHELDLAK